MAQQETNPVAAAVSVESHDVATRVDPNRIRTPRQRSRYIDIDVRKGALAQQKTTNDQRVVGDGKVGTRDVALRVDPKRFRSSRCAGYIDFRELGFVRKVSSIVGPTGSRDPRH